MLLFLRTLGIWCIQKRGFRFSHTCFPSADIFFRYFVVLNSLEENGFRFDQEDYRHIIVSNILLKKPKRKKYVTQRNLSLDVGKKVRFRKEKTQEKKANEFFGLYLFLFVVVFMVLLSLSLSLLKFLLVIGLSISNRFVFYLVIFVFFFCMHLICLFVRSYFRY